MCKNVIECRYYDPDDKMCMLHKKPAHESMDECLHFKNRTWNHEALQKTVNQ